MRSRTHLGTTFGDGGFKGKHRTDHKRDLCIMACVFCKDPVFQDWLAGMVKPELGDVVFTEEQAKSFILKACQVTSRNDLDTDTAAGLRFLQLVRTPFMDWKEQQAFTDPALGEPWDQS